MAEPFPDPGINESVAEQALMEWLGRDGVGYQTLSGGEIAPGSPKAERDSYRDVVLMGRLKAAIENLNPKVPPTARDEALRKVLRTESPSLLVNNSRFHDLLVDGIDVEVMTPEGIRGEKVWLIDFERPDNN
ncbi:MAG: type I restriction endonuclease, partial [Actinomycetota bacterium]